jgi:hypothetical protein
MSSPDERDRVIQFEGAADAVLRPIVVVELAMFFYNPVSSGLIESPSNLSTM